MATASLSEAAPLEGLIIVKEASSIEWHQKGESHSDSELHDFSSRASSC